MDTEHARQLIPDYVLGLLSTEERQRVERHTQQCVACREALRRERQLEALVRGAVGRAVEATPRPSAARLRALRPAPPVRAPRHRHYRQLAPAALVMALLALALFLQTNWSGATAPAYAQTRWAATSVAATGAAATGAAATNAAATSAAKPAETTISTRAVPLATPQATIASVQLVPAAPAPTAGASR